MSFHAATAEGATPINSLSSNLTILWGMMGGSGSARHEGVSGAATRLYMNENMLMHTMPCSRGPVVWRPWSSKLSKPQRPQGLNQ